MTEMNTVAHADVHQDSKSGTRRKPGLHFRSSFRKRGRNFLYFCFRGGSTQNLNRNYLLAGILLPFGKQVIKDLVRQTELLNRNTGRDAFQFIAQIQTLKISVTIHKLGFSFNESKVLPFISVILYVIFGR